MSTILITGANRGIGLEFVRHFSAQDNYVIACCRQPHEATELAKLAGNVEACVDIVELDVANLQSIARLKTYLAEKPIDILILNAGVYGPTDQSFAVLESGDWITGFRVNTIGPFLIAQSLIANLEKGNHKKLVAITSELGSTTNHKGGRSVYRATKAALNNVMRGLSKELASRGILVGIFHPGWVRTDMGGSMAPLTPTDSVALLSQRIAELNAQTTGTYSDQTGTAIPW